MGQRYAIPADLPRFKGQRVVVMGGWAKALVMAGAALPLALTGWLAGCTKPPPSLTLPISSWPGYEYFYLAEQKGLARAEGLELKTLEFPNPQDIVHAYLRGEVALAPLTTVEVVDICARAPERCPVVVLVLDESLGGDQVMARPGIGSIPALRGRRVAVVPSTLGPFVLSRALEQHGLSLKDVQLRNLNLGAMPNALARGDVDAVAIYPPFSVQAAQQARATVLFDSRRIPGEVFDVLAVDPALLKDQAEVLVRLVRSWQAAHTLRRSHPDQAVALMARRQGLAPAEFTATEQGLRYPRLVDQRSLLAPDGPLRRNLAAVQRVQEQLGLLTRGALLPSVSDAAVTAALR